ncbi:hypothetical protein CW705_01925 [Candidatus Bathyarchaeota archaeon]|nr:MAG: hypothetical protein CW705_01925 [Candidatus Bathyarchaeota archaeon]
MSTDLDASKLIGKSVKILGEGRIGVIASFIMDASGQVKEVLIERDHGSLERYPMELLQIEDDEVLLSSPIEKRLRILSEKLPTTLKKRQALEKLSKDKIVPQTIYENLVKKFDKTLKELRDEARSLIEEIEKEADVEEDRIKTLQMARAFLEIEHAIGNVDEETYKRSIVALLRDMKNAQQKRLELLRIKEKISDLLEEKPEAAVEEKREAEASGEEEKGQKEQQKEETSKAVPVRITQ